MTRDILHIATASALAFLLISCSDTKKTDAPGGDSLASKTGAVATGPGPKLVSGEGKFRVDLPAGFSNPTEQTVHQTTDFGKGEMKIFASTMGEGTHERGTIIGYTDYPAEAFAPDSIEHRLDGARDNMLKSLAAKVEKEEKVTHDGHDGRSIYFSGEKDGKKIRGRTAYYVAAPRFYQILYITTDTGEDLDAPGVQTMFDSFHVGADAP